jgi:hypothetical protein
MVKFMKLYLQMITGLTMVFILSSVQLVTGQVLMLDNFDYPAGDLMTSHNWIQQQTTSTFPILVNNGGLTYPGYIGSAIGNAAALGVEGQDVFRGFVKQTLPGTIYLTCLAKVTSATAAGDFFISFKESATSTTNVNYRGRVWVKADASNNLAFGVTKGAMTSPMVPNYTSFTYSLNTTYLLVMKFTIVEGTVPNDSAQLFINPVVGNPEPVPSVICPDVFTGSDVGIGSVLLRQGTNGSSPTVIVDGVRVSKSWQSALTPSNVSTLSDLQVDGVSVSGFLPNVFAYNDTVPFGQPTVAISSTTSCIQATKVTNTTTTFPGNSTVIVTAENGTSSSTYTITHAYFFYTIVLSVNPSGTGTVAGGGVLPWGAPTTVTATPNSGYGFISWTELGNVVSTNPVYTFSPLYNTELVANFGQLYQVNATASPVAGGNISGAGTVVAGGTATLTATPNNGYIFENWTENGNVIGTSPVLSIANVTANHDVVGHFTESSTTFTVSATSNPAGAGVITGTGNVPAGGNITLTASQNSGYVFLNWTENGSVLGTLPSLTLTNIQTNHSLEANFRVVGVGFDDHETFGISVCPTVATDHVNIKSTRVIDEIRVTDMTGKTFFVQKAGEKVAVVSTSGWKRGAYLLRIIAGDQVSSHRIFKTDL